MLETPNGGRARDRDGWTEKEHRMSERSWQTRLAVTILVVASLALTGCPKKPDLGGAGGTGTTGAGGAPTGTAGGGAGAGSTAGGGTAGVGGVGSGTAGQGSNVSVGGTTLPSGPTPTDFAEATALKDVQFDFDRAEIVASAAETLNANANWLKANARTLVLIEGHCDERGTNEYNLALGQRRASATRDYLVSKGVDARRISLISYGKERPLCSEQGEGCWAKNRRAHFLIKR
jgi:peptidoglycan-associated lipoprotein